MANLPRWIHSPRVDSQAMLGAYTYVARREDPWYGKLLFRRHTFDDFGIPVAPAPASVRVVSCEERPCYRCENKRGGFQLKWMHITWMQEYKRAARPGSWDPDETDEITVALDKKCLQNRAEHQRNNYFAVEGMPHADDAGSVLPAGFTLLADGADGQRLTSRAAILV